jgi:SAM-dependent methyltransferase
MIEPEREKWNARYAAGAYADRAHPTELLADWLPRLPRGRALDVACGAGRNACFLAAHGFATDAVDISEVALARATDTAHGRGLQINWIQADLEARPLPFADRQYDLIVLVRYVNTALYTALTALLAPGGFLLAEQHLRTEAEVVGPRNPDFRLAPGTQRSLLANLDVLFEHEGLVDDPDGRRAALTQIIAGRRAA